ncbi:hypothetical protein AB0M11_30275 [Streptomyces sp. NPDC051987]|uniref:hypothetical protein n=1 Tax=Streptomyces sp. NPDC051987 TaxID=3155808 RepID=UPI003415EA3F
MIAVAASLLPVLGLLLYGMDRVEDWLGGGPPPARHARDRHLRLVHSADRPPTDPNPADPAPHHVDAA